MEDEGFVREWAPCTRVLSLLPPRVQSGLFSTELRLTCVDAVNDYLALGTNVGLVYWYNRKNGTIERLRCEVTQSAITYVKIVDTVDYMVAAGNTNGQVSVFQIPKVLPESVPEILKPKTERKVERYTVGDLHHSRITAIEWSKNGMRLFSGDKDGLIIMTEIDFYMHLCKSVEIVNEQYEIVQISYHQNSLLVSSVYRTILCERRENRWQVNQVGKKERKSLCPLGAVFQYSLAPGGAGEVAAYCARPGHRLWRADKAGEVLQTLLFKDALTNPTTIAELLNPCAAKQPACPDQQFGAVQVFRDHFIVTHNQHVLYILDPRSLTAVAVVDDLKRILCVSVNKDEIFVLEGERSLIRLGYAPEVDALSTGNDPLNMMTKSLTSSFHFAMNTVKELAHADSVGFLASVLEQSPSNEHPEVAEEVFELPPVKELPPDLAKNVLESMFDSYKEEEVHPSMADLQKKMRLYNMIAEPFKNEELIYSSKRNNKTLSANCTPKSTPVRKVNGKANEIISSAVTQVTNDESDEEIMKQIEEKEKILAKMLNLESLSITTKPPPEPHIDIKPPTTQKISPVNDIMTRSYPFTRGPKQEVKTKTTRELDITMPKLAKVPRGWNLGSIYVGGDDSFNISKSPDGIESEWEFV